MNAPDLLPDDPKLTAYALGELVGDERAAVEAALRRDPVLRAAVEEIRATAAQLEAALAAELADSAPFAPQRLELPTNGHAFTETSPRDRVVEYPPARAAVARADDEYTVGRRGKLLGFPQFYYVVGGLAAACFAVIVALRPERPPQAAALESAPFAHQPSAAASQPVHVARVIDVPLAPPLPATAPAHREVEGSATPESTPVAGPAGGPTQGLIGGDLSLLAQTKIEPQVQRGQQPPAVDTGLAGRSNALALSSVAPRASAREPTTAATVTTQLAVATPDTMSGLAVTVGGTLESVAAPSRRFGAPATAATPPPTLAARKSGATESKGAVGVTTSGGSTTLAPFATDNTDTLLRSRTDPAGSRLVASAAATGSASAAPTEGVVRLSAFSVTADRGSRGFSAAAMATDRIAERELLPPPPRNAQFARNNTEAYAYIRDNDFVSVALNRVSTFAVDVDTASYANVRRMIEAGTMPPRDAVRIEELINYFPYRYPAPRDELFAASVEVAEAPWAPQHQLVRIGLKGREVDPAKRPAANLVFLLDVSASMEGPNRLPLVKDSIRLLLQNLRAEDRVALVTYAGKSGVALPSTPVARASEILAALDRLTTGGSAAGAAGIQLAYEVARANFASEGINRVIMCTDGDFNVGAASEGELVRLIQQKAASGVFLTVLGFGTGNYKDSMLEKLAQHGNGNYGYIDTRREAEKLLVQQVSSTLVAIAKDVRVQVEFNPAKVASYRLIGYENRLLRREDFNDEKVDAGEVGAGHTVTALYEIVPVGAKSSLPAAEPDLDELRYGTSDAFSSRLVMPGNDVRRDDLLYVKVRYKKPDGLFGIFSRTQEFPVKPVGRSFSEASADFRFAAAVAQFGMILRDSPHRGTGTIGDVLAWAASAATKPVDDPGGYRGEFIDLVRKTQVLLQ